ncbi:uncharacterized protein LOC118749143 [Rhagoletis pomonella]|uniref:uncharacterized protein LOC118749143 n=1 Tax=Rhagoletis pomonella TaxID=28610 RepID=UPI00177E6449|nr:uncharacterized protein LOC118749143 [Rhagoletis pomonella]
MFDSPWNTTSGLIFKRIKFGDIVVDARVDTGSDLSLLRYDVFRKLRYPQLSSDKRRLVGIKESELNTIGGVTKETRVDNIAVEVTFHVTRSNDLRYEAVIGNDILKVANISFAEGVAMFTSKDHKDVEVNSTEVGGIIPVPFDNKEDKNQNYLLREFPALCLQNSLNDDEEFPPLNITHLSVEKQSALYSMVRQYTPKPNSESPVQMTIILADDVPIYQTPRRVSYADQRVIDDQVSNWLKDGIVQPSNSEYASPVVLVPKKDGTKRLC